MGVQVILTNEYSHRKLAIIDRKVLWGGSLNILSQPCSQEIMLRIESENLTDAIKLNDVFVMSKGDLARTMV